MNTRYLFRLLALSAALSAATACIFPYEVDLAENGEWPFVVEGDIQIGGKTTVYLSYVRPFQSKDTNEYALRPIQASGYIQGEDGTRVESRTAYDPISSSYHSGSYYSTSPGGVLEFDTSQLSPHQRYRLHFDLLSPGSVTESFESDWLEVCPAPTIDALSYSPHPEFEELWIGLSMHCNGSHYFRWTFEEAWEYHSDLSTFYEYKPERREIGYFEGPGLYYCWKENNSPQINIFSTANQTEDRFEELAFHTIALNDKRLQQLYRITVHLEAMSENAYTYWNNLQQSSEGQGSIFSPTPSEMASNVHCLTNSSTQVMGYLNAAELADAVMYYDNAEARFYKPDRPYETFEAEVGLDPLAMDAKYHAGFLPYSAVYGASPMPTAYIWVAAICIDCRKQGGTKTRPKDWPSSHY